MKPKLYAACCDPLNAIGFALDKCPAAEVRTFLTDWRLGEFWPEYEAWVLAGRAALKEQEGGE